MPFSDLKETEAWLRLQQLCNADYREAFFRGAKTAKKIQEANGLLLQPAILVMEKWKKRKR